MLKQVPAEAARLPRGNPLCDISEGEGPRNSNTTLLSHAFPQSNSAPLEARSAAHPHERVGAAPAPALLVERQSDGGAGLAWGPVDFDTRLRLTITNIHSHPFGKFKTDQPHINFHGYTTIPNRKKEKFTEELFNLHITVYQQGTKHCVYAWDSISKKTPVDTCYDDLDGTALQNEAVKVRNWAFGVIQSTGVSLAELAVAVGGLVQAMWALTTAGAGA